MSKAPISRSGQICWDSIGVIAGALAIQFTGWTLIDPIVALRIGLWVLPRTWVLLRDTTNVLLEGVPGHFALGEIREAIAEVPGVNGVHDLHVWSLASDDVSLTAHVELDQADDGESVRASVQTMLAQRFSIAHVTIQTEAEPCAEGDHLHP